MIILGLSTINKTVGKGHCCCPSCGIDTSYTLKQKNVFFTFMFLPIIPLLSKKVTLVCDNCKIEYIPTDKRLLSIFSNTINGEVLYTWANKFSRLAAFAVDLFLLLLFNFVLAYLIGKNPTLKSFFPNNFILTFLFFWFIYFFICEFVFRGYTLGKKLFAIRVSNTYEFRHLNLQQSLIRSFVKTISCICPIVFWIIFYTQGAKALHDYASTSVVIQKLKI